MISYLESVKTMPLLALPVRSALVTLPSARVLISPGSMLTEAQLQSAGAVTDVVSNSLFHTAGVARAAAAHPTARLWGPSGAREKHPELPWHGILGQDAWPYEAELAHVALGGMPKVGESVFVDRASRTLYVSDLIFNLVDASGVGPWIILLLFGTYRRFAVSKFFAMQIKDRAAFTASMKQLLALDFDAIAPGHGDLVERDGKAKLTAALAERGFVLT